MTIIDTIKKNNRWNDLRIKGKKVEFREGIIGKILSIIGASLIMDEYLKNPIIYVDYLAALTHRLHIHMLAQLHIHTLNM